MRLQTPRLLITSFDAATDLEPAAALYSDPEVMRYVAGGPHRSKSQTADVLRDYARQEGLTGYTYWALRSRADNSLIGDVGLFPIEGQGPDVELGFTLATRFWGQGIATEAGRACVAYGFDVLGLDELRALVVAENEASRRVLSKLGFVLTGPREAYGEAHLEFALAAHGSVPNG